jgi:RNA polymerase sigma factor (sigma-70 family)
MGPVVCAVIRADWWAEIARHEQCTEQAISSTIERIQSRLETLAFQLRRQIGCLPLASGCQTDSVAERLWRCVSYHWQRLGTDGPLSFDELVKRLESGKLGYPTAESNLLYEVVLAQALESREGAAAVAFDRDYMPLVRGFAKRVVGQRGEELVENFGAELIMPRKSHPPRIAGFHGRTTLAYWLRAVVTNFCLSESRKRQALLLTQEACLKMVPSNDLSADEENCEELLRPMFGAVVKDLGAADRLFITMLVLDEVPQKQLARSLGIDSGNVTRRRQRIAGRIWDALRRISTKEDKTEHVQDCLNLVLAGQNAELRGRLGKALAARFRVASADCGEDTKR